jgi:glutathione peroxidase
MIHAALIAAMAVSSVGPISTDRSIYQFTMKSIDGKEIPLEDYRGKVLLVVNVASKCGLTPQYDALEKLYKSKKGQGLVVLGFPANEFGSQEPGTNEEIKAFCAASYGVTFPMFAKIAVKGKEIHPLYQWLTEHTGEKEIAWNFAKFVIGRQGQILERFDPKTKPDSPEITKAIDEALAAKP